MGGKLLFCHGRTTACRTAEFLFILKRTECGLMGRGGKRLSSNSRGEDSPNNFQFSRSAAHPNKHDLNENLYPGFYQTRSKGKILLGRALSISLPILIGLGFYKAFTSDYNLEVEEKLMETFPGYEEAMENDPNYIQALELQKQKRRESSS